jgi:hypothetical protein
MPTVRERVEDQTVEPQLSEVMRNAFRKACYVLQLDHTRDDAMIDLVTAKIVELAEAGESDADRLCSQALIGVSEQMGGGAQGS